MRLLLDTHTILWAMLGDPKLSGRARSALENESNDVFVSVVCIWEIATKVRIGKMPEPGDLLRDPHSALERLGYRDLPLTLDHARLGGLLVHPHKDPFDRMMAAQALLEGLTLVSIDSVFDDLPVARLW
jgi:PIN domain nuclease of toxin-antitoxin system